MCVFWLVVLWTRWLSLLGVFGSKSSFGKGSVWDLGGVDYLLLHAESFRLRLLSHLWQRWSLEDLVTNNNLVFSNIHLFIIYLLHLLFLLWKRTNNKGWIMAIMTQNICISTLTKWLRGVVVFHILLTSKRPLVWSREETKIPKNSNMWSYLLW